MQGNYLGKAEVAAGAIGVALSCAAFGGQYDVVIANGRAARAPIAQ